MADNQSRLQSLSTEPSSDLSFCDDNFRSGGSSKKTRRVRKNVPYWTLSTITSGKFDPRKLTERQQVSYISMKSATNADDLEASPFRLDRLQLEKMSPFEGAVRRHGHSSTLSSVTSSEIDENTSPVKKRRHNHVSHMADTEEKTDVKVDTPCISQDQHRPPSAAFDEEGPLVEPKSLIFESEQISLPSHPPKSPDNAECAVDEIDGMQMLTLALESRESDIATAAAAIKPETLPKENPDHIKLDQLDSCVRGLLGGEEWQCALRARQVPKIHTSNATLLRFYQSLEEIQDVKLFNAIRNHCVRSIIRAYINGSSGDSGAALPVISMPDVLRELGHSIQIHLGN